MRNKTTSDVIILCNLCESRGYFNVTKAKALSKAAASKLDKAYCFTPYGCCDKHGETAKRW